MNEQKKNNGAKAAPEARTLIGLEEKAQYEVFATGDLPRERIEKMLKSDLESIIAFCYGTMRDQRIWSVFVDVYYERYKKLHAGQEAAQNDEP